MIKFLGNREMFGFEFEQASWPEILSEIRRRGSVAFDIETTGLDFLSDRILLVSLGWEDLQYVVDPRAYGLNPLGEVFADGNILKIAHNASFDMKFLTKDIGCAFENVHDTILAEMVVTNGLFDSGELKPYGLAAIMERRLGIRMDKSIRSSFHLNQDKPPTMAQIAYSAGDVEHLHKLRELQLEDARNMDVLYRTSLEAVVRLENEACLSFTEMEYNGLKVDVERWMSLERKSMEALNKASKALDKLVLADPKLDKFVNRAVQGDLFEGFPEDPEVTVSWDSPKQVSGLFEVLVGEKLPSVEERHLQKHMSHQLVRLYVSYKELAKLNSSYGKAFLANLRSDGKVHTSFKQILATGRVSSSNPNMQQIPQDNDYRNCFVPDSENEVFVSCDYSSQELTIIAMRSGEPEWIRALEENRDLHSLCAKLVFGDRWNKASIPGCAFERDGSKCSCPEHKKLRNLIKTVNFG